MSGHSKWNNIKNRKGAQDEKKGKMFSQFSKIIKTAVKEGGSEDPKSNATLRLAIEKARAANMPKEKIQKAIDRGLGKTAAGVSLRDIVYEAFTKTGAGLLIETSTENTNRTSSEVRFLLTKHGASLGSPGSAAYLFQREGNEYKINIPMQITDEKDQEELQELIDALRELDDVEDVYCSGVWEGKE